MTTDKAARDYTANPMTVSELKAARAAGNRPQARGANLHGADLGGANLGGANLYGANLGGANLYGAIGGLPSFDVGVPPEGDGWQMWEDVSEGSPISPVFDAPEPLAHWLADNETYPRATFDQWLATIHAGWAPSFIFSSATGPISGVEAAGGAS